MEIIQDIGRGNLQSAYVVGAFDKAKPALEDAGYEVISAEQEAGLRMQEEADSSVSRRGNWTREGVIYVPKKGAFLTKNSPIMDNAVEATTCHREDREFYLTDEQVERALADSVRFEAREIPSNRLAGDEITAFAFGKNAREYGEFLSKAGIDSIRTYAAVADLESKPFARQLWFGRLGGAGKSGLYGCIWNLRYDDNDIRGFRASQESSRSKL